ncbi:MAG TPA: hypothetical protein VFP97_00100, partial [Chitinophagaceae bacterium]|nr:hypothetical protein [Chitinophagaceae bacterium]
SSSEPSTLIDAVIGVAINSFLAESGLKTPASWEKIMSELRDMNIVIPGLNNLALINLGK